MSKIPKKAQVVFNQFIFDTMMAKIREVELLEKKIAAQENWHRNHTDTHLLLNRNNEELNQRIAKLEKELKDQREDYHAHIRQLVTENEAAHKQLITSIETLRTQIKNLCARNDALTNAVLNLQRARDAKGRFKK
jgi:chromosome segregation ATPase